MKDNTVLILGGYGNAGLAIARLLVSQTKVGIILAGRTGNKAQRAAQQLNSEFQTDCVSGMQVNAASKESLIQTFQQVGIVVVASSTIEFTQIVALPTNPVHILDLVFFLPAVIATGVMLIKQRPLAYTLAPTFIVFLILTGIPILLTPVVQTARGEAAAWGVVLPIGALTAVLSALLVWLLSTIRTQEIGVSK